MSDPSKYAEDEAEDGLAEERTDLAWGRSGLSLMACGAAIAKGLPTISGSVAEPAVGAIVLVLGGAIWILGWRNTRRHQRQLATVHGPEGDRPVALDHHLAAIAYGTTAVGLAAIYLALRTGS